MTKVHLKYFAMLREARGCKEETIEVPPGATAASIYRDLFPAQHQQGLPVSFAVNSMYVKEDTVLQEADELAFLPPVGGG